MRLKTESRRTAIINAAAAIFLENGYDKTTMSDISDRVGGSKATLYGYFPSKVDLFLETIRTLAEEHFAAAFGQLSAPGDLRTTLLEFGQSMLRVMTSDDTLAMHRLIVVGSADPTVAKRMFAQGPQQGDLAIKTLLEMAMARGELRECDSRVAADHLRGLLESEYMHKRLFGVMKAPSKREIAGAVERAVDVFLTAYGV